jgi:acid phosphatase
MRAFTSFPLFAAWAGFAAAIASAAAESPLAQPPNLTEAKEAVRAYHASGAYQRDIDAVTAMAAAWVAQRAPQVARPALVLDVDETALSNWQAYAANDFGRFYRGPCDDPDRGPCGLDAWHDRAAAPAIPGTLALFREARALGVAVIFITGRLENARPETERNLAAAGYDGYERLLMRPDTRPRPTNAEFKPAARAGIEAEGFTIIANVGDQRADLAGGHAEASFLLPNPLYRAN